MVPRSRDARRGSALLSATTTTILSKCHDHKSDRILGHVTALACRTWSKIVPCCTHCWDLVGAAVLDHVCIQLWLTTNDLLNHAREWVRFMQHSMQSFPFQTACVEGTVHVLLENSPKPLVACKEHGADTEPPSTPRSGSPKEPSEPVCPFHGLLEGEGSLRSHDPCFDDVEGSRQPSCQSTRDTPPKHLGQGAPIKMLAKAAGPPDSKE